MARLTMAQRRKLPKQDFAVPSKAPGPGSYPEPDAKHARVAVGLAAMHGNASAESKARSLGKKRGLIHSKVNDNDNDDE